MILDTPVAADYGLIFNSSGIVRSPGSVSESYALVSVDIN